MSIKTVKYRQVQKKKKTSRISWLQYARTFDIYHENRKFFIIKFLNNFMI